MISNIQFLRAFAALAVTFYHAGFSIHGVHTDFQGVSLFFCVSGFIMVHISRERSTEGFFAARLIRIVPLYWIATIAFYLWNQMGLANPPYVWPLMLDFVLHRPADLWVWVRDHHGVNGETALALARSLLFIPYQDSAGQVQPVLAVGWTLNLEMFFYTVFAVALRVSRRWAALLVGAVLLMVKLAAILLPNPLLAFYAHPYTTYFVLGMGAYYVLRAMPAQVCRKHRIGLLGATTIVCVAFLLWPFVLGGHDAMLVQLVFWVFPPTLLILAVGLHAADLSVQSRPWLLLGAASYSLYLMHPFVMDSARPVGEKWAWLHTGNSVTGLVIAVLASVALAVLVHSLVEVPLSRRLKRGSDAIPGPAAAAPA